MRRFLDENDGVNLIPIKEQVADGSENRSSIRNWEETCAARQVEILLDDSAAFYFLAVTCFVPA